jgi:hypothetical protein
MRRREDFAITKHTLNLYEGHYEYLQNYYGTRIGAAKVIRDLVRDHVKALESKRLRRLDAQTETEFVA